ncbi:MAG: ethylbenzene dehydrogenase-related protein [Actinomycetota bacterium]
MERSDMGTITRRQLLTGGITGTAALVVASCGPDANDAIPKGEIFVARVKSVPLLDPSTRDWENGPKAIIDMGSQDIAPPVKNVSSVTQLAVRAVHDGTSIGIRIEWDDAETNDLTVRVDDFRDACAVLLAAGAGDASVRTMGTPASPATLLHWKADWERDVQLGVQGELDVYPNRSVDTYPPLVVDNPTTLTPMDYVKAGATDWLPGLAVGNPLSAATRPTSVEKLVAIGFGTATSCKTQDVVGIGKRTKKGWRVAIVKPMTASDESETALHAGGTATCAFAIWSGSDRDSGGHKSPSVNTFRMQLEA